MKLQHLTVIFIVIVVPVTFIMSMYMGAQIDSIQIQSSYNTKLMDATYDAIKAFQLNTVNNRYSSVSNSKIRDIEAGISTFYNSLGTSMDMSSDALRQYTPAILNTLYDGYYIYSKYSNTKSNNQYEYGLQPYIYYSCRYKKGNTDCVINYTLDNAITVYGTVRGEYVTKTGFLINPEEIDLLSRQRINANIQLDSLKYKGLDIKKEYLQETLIILENINGNAVASKPKTYPYTFYNNKKVYWDKDKKHPDGGNYYFWYDNFQQTIINDPATRTYANNTVGQNRSAISYYVEAYKFSKWVKENLGDITAEDAINAKGEKIKFETNNTYAEPIFNFSSNNDPEKSESLFETHRRAVIRYTIETSLIAAMANYNLYTTSGYEYVLPKLSEIDWEKITSEVCFTTFLQGLPIGAKYYNSYCVIANNQNKEFISKTSMVILTDENGVKTYHRPNCKHLIDNINSINIDGVYTKLQIARQTVDLSDDSKVYFFPHEPTSGPIYTYCYDCIVNIAEVYNLDQLIDGEIVIMDQNDREIRKIQKDALKKVREAYFTALAREKYDLYYSISLISGS